MSLDTYVKWSEEAQRFWELASDYSIDLEIHVSHGCFSQTDEGFEELVNSINREDIKRKIKKINILDASYLYRHCIHDFSQLSNQGKQSIWFINNWHLIERIECDVAIDSWVNKVNSEEFKRWYAQIMVDFAGNPDGSGIVQDFRDMVVSEAGKSVAKKHGTLENCINFILEERAIACAFHKNTVIIYPIPFSRSMLDICKRYDLNIKQLSYSLSKKLQKQQHKQLHKMHDHSKICEQVMSSLNLALKANIFVIDQYGRYIYRNNALSEVLGSFEDRVTLIDSWEISKKVIRTGKSITVEEKCNGNVFLSSKSPLIIDGKIEGVIGVAIDITEKKKIDELIHKAELQELQLQEQEKFKIFAQQVSHDIRSPLVTLSMLMNACKNLPENEYVALRNVITSIENISNNLLNTYEKNGKITSQEAEYILLPLSLTEITKEKKYQYQTANVEFNFSNKLSRQLVFIRGDYLNYARMISNLLNNSAEAIEGRDGLVEVSCSEKNQLVEIHIKDNGKGMPEEMVDKFMSNIPVGTTKASGHGLGMQQIKDTLQKMNGKMLIESTENVGTEFTLTFPRSESPKWFAEKVVLPKGGTIVVLDDDPSIHSVWESRLKDYSDDITAKYFTQGSEAIDFINSSKEKNRIFLLTDYELRNQNVNGVDVIEKCNMHRQSIVTTSVYICKIKEFYEKCDIIKILAKALIPDIPIIIEKERDTENVAIVIIDNDESMTSALSTFFKDNGLAVNAYTDPRDFLEKLPRYSKNIIIVTDHDLGCDISGFDLAKKAYELGYTKLYMMSGDMFDKSDVPSYLTLLFKDTGSFEKLLKIANESNCPRPT